MKSAWVKRIAVDKKRNEWVERWVKVQNWSHEKLMLRGVIEDPSFLVMVSFSIVLAGVYFIHG